MIERVFVLSELRDSLDFDLRLLAGAAAGSSETPALGSRIADSPDIGGSGSDARGPFELQPVWSLTDGTAEALKDEVRVLLPWRSLEDGTPVAMEVVAAGVVAVDDGARRAGTLFVTVVADSWDAVDAIQDALDDIAGLDAAEWVSGWTRSSHGFREITIFPPSALAA